jgi:predicted amidohydrolase
MKICVAQTKPVKGDIRANAEAHKKLIHLAVSNSADTIIFPELSLTGYEPAIAKQLAVFADDQSLDDFQSISDIENVTIGVGIPVKSEQGILIAMIILQPHKPRHTYFKQHIHPDEEPFFINGQYQPIFPGSSNRIALAICYELSIPEHSKKAWESGAEIYIASVAKSIEGVDTALATLAHIARRYSMLVLMANCVGECDGAICGGKTSVWSKEGILLGQLNDAAEGLLIIDTDSQQVKQFNL